MTSSLLFFFFNDTATTEIYTLSLHDALPIRSARPTPARWSPTSTIRRPNTSSCRSWTRSEETRLNSSHLVISYAVFCLKKKKKIKHYTIENQNAQQQSIFATK